MRNFVSLSPINADNLKIGSIAFPPTGQGSGWWGLPGDWTPPSRFVRAALLTRTATIPQDSAGAVNLAAHILNTFDIPKGIIEQPVGKDIHRDYTQWIVIKDLTRRMLYFRAYGGHGLNAIDLQQLDFSPGARFSTLPITTGAGIVDLTDTLQAPVGAN